MPRQRLTKKEETLALHIAVERLLSRFLKRCGRPRQRYPRVEAALEEVNHERLLLGGVMSGTIPGEVRRIANVERSGT